MTSQSFDIESLLGFAPAKFLCEKCYALLRQAPIIWEQERAKCPICDVEYVATDEFKYYQVDKYLKEMKHDIQFDKLIVHAQELATIARRSKRYLSAQDNKKPIVDSYPPMRALFDALRSAQKFVHFTTYGISDMLIGALKMTAQRVDVRGIISGVDNRQIEELTKYENEAPRMKVKIFVNHRPQVQRDRRQ